MLVFDRKSNKTNTESFTIIERMNDVALQSVVAEAGKGSEAAYRELVGRFGSRLLGYFYRNTGNRTEAEDLVGECFLRLVKGLRKYKEKERFEVWLYRLAHNLMIDYWRKKKMVDAGEMIEGGGELCGIGSGRGRSQDDPVVSAMDKESQDELQKAVMKLSPEQRETILMRYFSGLAFEEIAELSGVPLGTALARAHRGLKRLKELLAEQPEMVKTPVAGEVER